MRHLKKTLPDPKLRLLQATLTSIDARWAYNLRSPFWRLYLNDRDGAAIIHQGRRFPLEAGRIYLLPAWGDFRSSCMTTVQHFFLHFDPIGWDLWARRHCTELITLPADPLLDDLAKRLIRSWDRPEASLQCESLLHFALGNLIPLLPEAALAELVAHGQPDHVLARAFELFNENPTRSVSVAAMAKACKLSTDHFTRCFKIRTGSTPARYEAERRCARAAEQLLADDSDIASIAEANGFANRYHFTRVFSRLMGQSPAAYRKSRLLSGKDGQIF